MASAFIVDKKSLTSLSSFVVLLSEKILHLIDYLLFAVQASIAACISSAISLT